MLPDAPVPVIVGVGASTGGLDALRRLVERLPTGRGVAVVLVKHMEPTQEDLLVGLLQQHTPFAVVEAAEGQVVQADHLYVIPPGKYLSIGGGKLSLDAPLHCNGLRMLIDHFFCALAADQGPRACGVLLSGGGADGTLGLSEIKANGGRTIAQDPATAEAAHMPQNAIAAGVVDEVHPVDAIAEAVLAFASRAPVDAAGPHDDDALRAILAALRAHIGHDFRCYKRGTLLRRIQRRIGLGRYADVADYARRIQSEPQEVLALQKDLLIGVTDFFRQPEAWNVLAREVLPGLIASAGPAHPLRAWVPGCASGKEAYTLAMLLVEMSEAGGERIPIQIFATDTHPDALEIARAGIYTRADLGRHLSRERIERFFTTKAGRHQVTPQLRELIVFAPQNLTADPPFSRLDLVTCRNLLIYLDHETQKKIVGLFHFALRDGGFLFLGNAESIMGREELFEPVSKKWRIYRRIGVGRRVELELPLPVAGLPKGLRLPAAATPRTASLASIAQQILVERFAPAAVLIDRKRQLLYSHGRVEDYLAVPPGEPSMDVAELARDGLRGRLRAAINKAVDGNRPITVTARIQRASRSVPVRATITPLRVPREADGLLLVAFEEYRPVRAPAPEQVPGEGGLRHLEDELKITREELSSTIEQLEASNEQLKAANEEAVASNEELQSSNEELETSKEELQSLNEELNTVNQRLYEKVSEQAGTNNDLLNFLGSTNIATIFLDRSLGVRRFTPAVAALMNLIPSDIGRPVADVAWKFRDAALIADCQQVLSSLQPVSTEIRADDGRWYLRRVTPYRTQDDHIDGVVVSFLDIDEVKQGQESLRVLSRFPEENPNPVLRISNRGTVLYANRASARLLEHWGAAVDQALPELWPQRIEAILQAGRLVEEEVVCGDNTYSCVLAPVVELGYVNIYGRDITERKQAEGALRASEETARQRLVEIESIYDSALIGLAVLDRDLRYVRINEQLAEINGFTVAEHLGRTVRAVVPGIADEAEAMLRRILETGEPVLNYEITGETPAQPGVTRTWVESWLPLKDAAGHVVEISLVAEEITNRKRAEAALKDSQQRLAGIVGSAMDAIVSVDAEQRIVLFNEAAEKMFRCPAADAVGQPLEKFIPGRFHAAHAEHIRRFAETGTTTRMMGGLGELVALRTDGAEFPIEASISQGEVGGGKMFTVILRDITERKRVEEALRRKEADLKEAQRMAHIGSWHWDALTDVTTGSDELLRIYGFDPATQAMPDFREQRGRCYPVEDWERVNAAVQKTVETGIGYELDVRVIRNATTIWITTTSEAVRDADGRIVGLRGTVQDITERKQAEQALEAMRLEAVSEKNRLEAVMDTLPVGVAITDAQGGNIRSNRAFADVWGGGHPETQSVADYVAYQAWWADSGRPVEPEEWASAQAVSKGETVVGQLLEIRRFDGRRGFVINSAAPVLDAAGRIAGSAVAILDISEQKQTEERLRLLSEVTAELLASDHPQQLVESLCRKVMEQLGCDLFFNFLVDDEAGRLHLNASAGIPQPTVGEIEWLDFGAAVCGCVARDGARIVAENVQTTPDPRTDLVRSFGVQAYACHPLVNQGRVVGTLSFGSRTKTAFAAEELALMKAVADQTAIAMQRIRLVESLERHARDAQAANVAKGQFLANMSHELRTPMTAILGMTDLALGEPLSPTVRDHLQTVQDSAGHLLTLLNGILDFSRIESGRLMLDPEPFSFRGLLDESLKLLAVRAQEKGLELIGDVPAAVPDGVIGDRHHLRQTLINLIGNAIKFTPAGEVAVRVAVLGQTPSEVELELAVSDTGVGISEDAQTRIFEPFTQADASTTRHYGGTGLGLAIASNLARLMGGQMWVNSRLGHGSTFHFTAKLLLQAESASATAPAILERLRGLPVLVVDDNESNRRVLSAMLAAWSMQPEVASDVPTALAMLHEAAATGKRIPLVILDAIMPGENGLVLAERIKQDPSLAGASLILLSSGDWSSQAKRCEELGIVAHTEKPISQNDLLRTIARAIGMSMETGPETGAVGAIPAGPAPRTLRILLAEDTPANQKLVMRILSKRGHQVEVAHNGLEALKRVQEEDFDVVLMDVQMPAMDGYQATEAIRKLPLPRKATVPIIAMTAHAMKGAAERCLAAGMNAYAAKPINVAELIASVERLGGR